MGGFMAPRVKRPGVDLTAGRSWGTMEDPAGAPPTGVMVSEPMGGTPKVGGGGVRPTFSPVVSGPAAAGGGESLEQRRARMRRQRLGPGGGLAEGPVTPPPPILGTAPGRIIDALRGRGGGGLPGFSRGYGMPQGPMGRVGSPVLPPSPPILPPPTRMNPEDGWATSPWAPRERYNFY